MKGSPGVLDNTPNRVVYMYAAVCILLSNGCDRSKSRGEPKVCICRNQDPAESAKQAIIHLIGPKPGEKIELECVRFFKGDGRHYPLIIDNTETIDWVVYTKEIASDVDVTDLLYVETGDRYFFRRRRI
jgi:hypothetical protein